MAVKIRLMRMGAKKRPTYRIVVTDSRARRDGEYLELVGTYSPLEKDNTTKINEEVALKWLDRGAIPSDTVRSLLKNLLKIKLKRNQNNGFSKTCNNSC